MTIPAPAQDEMPAWLGWIRRNIWAISFVLGAITITILTPFTRRVPEPPPVLYSLPDDWGDLVTHRGEPFGPQTLRGKVWVAGFIFTRCPSRCPAITRAMLELRERLDRNRIDVEMVSFTVDPEFDTPEVLARYAGSVAGDHGGWSFVSGPKADIDALVGDGFKLALDEASQNEAGELEIGHASKLALVDENGGIRGYYGIDSETGIDEIYERADRVWMETQRRPPVWERGWLQ